MPFLSNERRAGLSKFAPKIKMQQVPSEIPADVFLDGLPKIDADHIEALTTFVKSLRFKLGPQFPEQTQFAQNRFGLVVPNSRFRFDPRQTHKHLVLMHSVLPDPLDRLNLEIDLRNATFEFLQSQPGIKQTLKEPKSTPMGVTACYQEGFPIWVVMENRDMDRLINEMRDAKSPRESLVVLHRDRLLHRAEAPKPKTVSIYP